MFRGYRLFILALVGIISFIAFGTGVLIGVSNYPDEQRHQPYRSAADKIPDIDPAITGPANPEALKDRSPCEKPKGKDESDLCAQWRAAKAAENSATWTKWGVWVGVIGSTFLLWQIILTRKAVEDTSEATKAMREANEITKHNTQLQLRAYFAPEGITSDVRTFDGVQFLDIRINWKNFGSTPTKNLRFIALGLWGDVPQEISVNLMDDSIRHVVGPGASIWSNPVTLTMADVDDVWSLRKPFHIVGYAEYEDIIRRETHHTEHLWGITIMRDNMKGLEGDNILRVHWTVVGVFNDAT